MIEKLCKLFLDLIQTDKRIQYAIELGMCGLVDSDHLDTVSLDDRLHLLDRYQDGARWDAVSIERCDSITPVDAISSAKQYCQWNWICYKLDDAKRSKIVVSQLPSRLRGITERTVVSHEPGFIVEDFDIDPYNNLLVLAEKLYVLLWLCLSYHSITLPLAQICFAFIFIPWIRARPIQSSLSLNWTCPRLLISAAL